ncbi:MAG: cobalamin B12-binding domain-containing protein [Gemmatimonadota bacterium]
MTDKKYEIKQVAELTGLETSRLRAWERRYQIVRPERLANGYRVYTSEQVALLRAYARLISAGARIGSLVKRPWQDVIVEAEMGRKDDLLHGPLIEAAMALDRPRLENLVHFQLRQLGARRFAEDVVVPFAQAVGDLWALGLLPVVAEHMASEVVVHALKGALRAPRADGPLVVGATLPGERHEWGILTTLTVVQDLGWRVYYLGADLPLVDLLAAAWKLRPRCVAISVSTPETIVANLAGLSDLPHRLPPGADAFIGGGGIATHARRLSACGFKLGTDARAFIE